MKIVSVSLPATYTDDDPLDLAGKQPLFEAMNTEWWKLDHEEQKQAIVNAFRATMLSPRMNLKSNAILYQSIMHIPADESDPDVFENTIRELKQRWDAQGQMGLEQSPEDVLAVDEILPGKFLPGFWGNLRRLANLGPYAEELARIANEDMQNGGKGEIFRSGVLTLGIPGVGPKVASFAWLALAPMTSELATIDVHMMRYLGEGDDSPKSDEEYVALEKRLREERDQVYPGVPLTQYQWGVWDKQRTPGFHQDHTPLRAYDPIPYRDVNWAKPTVPPRPKKPVVQDPGQLTLGKTATAVATVDVPTERGERWGETDLPFVFIPDRDTIYVASTPCSHPELMKFIYGEQIDRQDMLDWNGLVAGEFTPMFGSYKASILYTDEQENNFDRIYAWAKAYGESMSSMEKTAIIAGHIGSWIYFMDTNEFDLAWTHMTVMSILNQDIPGRDMNKDLESFQDRPMIVGQMNDEGEVEVYTDWSTLRDVAVDDQMLLPQIQAMADKVVDSIELPSRSERLFMLDQMLHRSILFQNWNGEIRQIPLKREGKIAGNLTNSFIYYNGKLVVENKPHPIILRNHFPGIIPDNHAFTDPDLQAGLIFEENGKIYPVFHSYTVTSQERKREALAALETYYHRPIGEELDYDEAMNRLSKMSKVEFVDHEYDDTWGQNPDDTRAIVYDPRSHTTYIGGLGSSHGALMKAIPELKGELRRYDNDTFQQFTNVGYYHHYKNDPSLYWLHGEKMSSQEEAEALRWLNDPRGRRPTSAWYENPLGGFHSFFFMDGYLYMGEEPYTNHQDLSEQYELDYTDFLNNSWVAGVVWPQKDDYGDIQFYSDYLADMSENLEEMGEDYEDLNERNRTEGQMTTRALTGVYEWAQKKYHGDIQLTVHGTPIEEYLPPSVVKQTAVGMPTKFRSWPSPIRYVTTKDGTIYTDADSPRPTHQAILIDNGIDPNDVTDAGHFEENGEMVSLWNYEFGNGEKGQDQYRQLWGISKAMSVVYVPARSDPFMSGGVSYAYDTGTDTLYWTDGHHPDIYRTVFETEDIKRTVETPYGLGQYSPLENFIWGFYYEGDDELDQASGNIQFEKIPLPAFKQNEIITTLQHILEEEREKLGSRLIRMAGFRIVSADVVQLAQKAYDKLMEREDMVKWKELANKEYNDAVAEKGEENVYESELPQYFTPYGRLIVILDKLKKEAPETYKMWPWFVRETKKGRAPDVFQIGHIRDILTQAKQHMDKLRDNPQGGVPDINQLTWQELEEWTYEQNASGNSGDVDPNTITMHTFDNGWTVKCLGADDLAREGELMGHCVGGYCNEVRRDATYIFSLRDKKNEPHVTIEIEPDNGNYNIIQVQGKQNRDPEPEYKEMVKEFFQNFRWGPLRFSGGTIESEWEFEQWTRAGGEAEEYGVEAGKPNVEWEWLLEAAINSYGNRFEVDYNLDEYQTAKLLVLSEQKWSAFEILAERIAEEQVENRIGFRADYIDDARRDAEERTPFEFYDSNGYTDEEGEIDEYAYQEAYDEAHEEWERQIDQEAEALADERWQEAKDDAMANVESWLYNVGRNYRELAGSHTSSVDQVEVPFGSPTTIYAVDTPRASHGEGSGFPFFYNIATDTLWVGKGESLHMELIQNAGIDLTEDDYLYGAGGDAGWTAGFLSGRVGSEWGEPFFLFEGTHNMLSRDALDYLNHVAETRKVAKIAAAQVHTLYDDLDTHDITFLYDPKTDDLWLTRGDDYHVSILEAMGKMEYTEDPDDSFQFRPDFVMGRDSAMWGFSFYSGDVPAQRRATELLEQWQNQNSPHEAAAHWPVIWIDMVDESHGYGLPFFVLDNKFVIGDRQGYHTKLADNFSFDGEPWTAVRYDLPLGRVDRFGQAIIFNVVDEETKQACIDTLRDIWPQIKAVFDEIEPTDGDNLVDLGWGDQLVKVSAAWTVVGIPEEDEEDHEYLSMRAWMADIATKTIYASEYHYTIFSKLGLKGMLDAGEEEAAATHMPMGIFIPPWTFDVWYGQEYLAEGQAQEIEAVLKQYANSHESKTTDSNYDPMTWVQCDSKHGLGLPVLYINGMTYIGLNQGYHTILFGNIQDVKEMPDYVVAARIDVYGNVVRYDFDTDREPDYNEEDEEPEIVGPGDDDVDSMYRTLQNRWPEIYDRLVEIDSIDDLGSIGWPNITNVAEMYEEHQQMLRDDPSMQGYISAVYIRGNPSSYSRGDNERRPVVVNAETGDLFVGHPGTYHEDVFYGMNEDEYPDQYYAGSYYSATPAETLAGHYYEAEPAHMEWYDYRGQAGRPSAEDSQRYTDEIEAALANKRITKKAEADMQGAMLALRVPINIANAIKMDGGEPPELMHITLAYFKDKAADRNDWDQVIEIVKPYNTLFPVTGEIVGYDTFDNDEVVLWAKPVVGGLNTVREAIVKDLNEAGFAVDDKFDFNPHITVAYNWTGDVPELEQPIPITFDGLYFYQGAKIQKVAKLIEVNNDSSSEDYMWENERNPVLIDFNSANVYIGSPGTHHADLFEEIPHDDDDMDFWNGLIPGFYVRPGMEGVEEYAPEAGFYFMGRNVAPALVDIAKEHFPNDNIWALSYPDPPKKFAKIAKVVRLGYDTQYGANPNTGFERGARAFAYDPESDTIWTHTGHHPDIVKELYNDVDMYSDEGIAALKKAANDYLWGWANGPDAHNPNKIGAWSGNVKGNKPISDNMLVAIWQQIWNSDEIPQIQDSWGWSAMGRDPVTSKVNYVPNDYVHLGYENRRPVIWDSKTGEIYMGSQGAWHSDIYRNMGWSFDDAERYYHGVWEGGRNPIRWYNTPPIWLRDSVEEEIQQAAQEFAQNRTAAGAKLLAPHIFEVFPIYNGNFIFLYNPEDDNLYIAPTAKYHIDLINYALGEKKLTNPDQSYEYMRQFVLGIWYDGRSQPDYHAYPSEPGVADRVLELCQIVQAIAGTPQ